MIYLLAKPQQIKDTDWIRPGKATWEWWHCAILEKATFPFRSSKPFDADVQVLY